MKNQRFCNRRNFGTRCNLRRNLGTSCDVRAKYKHENLATGKYAKDGLYFLANASIDSEGIVVNVDKWTVVAYNASTQTRNPNLQVYALGEFGILSQ